MKKFVSLLIIIILILGMIPAYVFAAISFKDVPKDAWYKADLDYVTKDTRKIITGYANGKFGPNDSLTVGQFLKIAVTASGRLAAGAKKNEKWYAPFVTKAKEMGLVKNGEFSNYERNITRAEVARIIVRSIENTSGTVTYRDTNIIKNLIKDYDKIPESLQTYVLRVYDLKIMGGYDNGTFGSNDKLTRAQAVTITAKLIDKNRRVNAALDKAFESNKIKTNTSDTFYKINSAMPPELYQIPLKVSDFDGSLQTNTWMIDRYGIKYITELMNIGKGYMETFFTVDYKTYDKTKYINSLQWYFMPKTAWTADDGIERPISEHLNYWAEKVKEKQISISTQFITDPSLVYGRTDGAVRGKVIFQVNSCNDMKWLGTFDKLFQNAQVGKKYSCVFEVGTANMELKDGWKHAVEVVVNESILSDIKEVKE